MDKLEAPLPTLEVPQKPTEPAEPAVKRGRGRPRKNPVTENHLTSVDTFIDTSADISAKQSPHADISVLVQEAPFTDLRRKEINRLLKKGIFAVITERDVL